MARKYARIFVRGHYLFREANSFPRAKLEENCELRGTDNVHYCSFKIFSCFWLVKTTRIIHHNQLLFTKFGKNRRHIESITSKVEPTENYWPIDVKMTSKVQPAADYWIVDRENLGTRLCYLVSGKTKSVMARLL